jgi:hypothetical protein
MKDTFNQGFDAEGSFCWSGELGMKSYTKVILTGKTNWTCFFCPTGAAKAAEIGASATEV